MLNQHVKSRTNSQGWRYDRPSAPWLGFDAKSASGRCHGARGLFFTPTISSTNGAGAGRNTGNTPATAPIGSRGRAAINLERDRPGCRARNWIRESRDFYARLSHPIWRHAIRFSQESRKDAAAINTGCTFHRTPHSSCLRKHLTRRSRQRRTASVWKSQNHTPLSGKRSPATSIPGGRKIFMPAHRRSEWSSN